MTKNTKLKVTLSRSTIGIKPKHKGTIIGLGLRKINDSVVLEDTKINRGMINKTSHLLKVEEV